MSEFVKEKLKVPSLENGKAFYEFTQPEDLTFYKEIIYTDAELMDKVNIYQM